MAEVIELYDFLAGVDPSLSKHPRRLSSTQTKARGRSMNLFHNRPILFHIAFADFGNCRDNLPLFDSYGYVQTYSNLAVSRDLFCLISRAVRKSRWCSIPTFPVWPGCSVSPAFGSIPHVNFACPSTKRVVTYIKQGPE
jgi:hypothetical protein